MTQIERRTTIDAPAEAVFAILLDIEQSPAWLDGLQEVHNLTGQQVGDSFEWTYKMVGMSYTGRTAITALEPGRHLREESSGGITSSWDWNLSTPAPGQTEVRTVVNYTVPGSIFGKIADKLFIERENERSLERSLSNLKARAEAQHVRAAT